MKYFKKIYSNRVAFGKWSEGDGINYNEPGDKSYTVEFIEESEYINGVKNMEPIPKTKEQLIAEEIECLAIESLESKGLLDSEGELLTEESK